MVKRSKTSPFHGENMGSNPVGVTTYGRLAQLGERLPYKQDVSSSILLSPTKIFFQGIHICVCLFSVCMLETCIENRRFRSEIAYGIVETASEKK